MKEQTSINKNNNITEEKKFVNDHILILLLFFFNIIVCQYIQSCESSLLYVNYKLLGARFINLLVGEFYQEKNQTLNTFHVL